MEEVSSPPDYFCTPPTSSTTTSLRNSTPQNHKNAPLSPSVERSVSLASPSLSSTPSGSLYLTPAQYIDSPCPFSPSPSPPPASIAISWPANDELTLDWIQNLMTVFDWSSWKLEPPEFPNVLPVDVFDSLVLRASRILHNEPNCVMIDDCVSDSRVVVVGDVHGQLHDVLFLLRHAGFPSENLIYVFNGDYVDRGAWGLETFLILLAWKVLMPNRVFLLRGNHESKYCTSVYGFEKEVMTKYGNQGRHVYCKCLGCFEGLPLASVIAGCVYTAHGGIFRGMALTSSKKTYKGKKSRMKTKRKLKSLTLGSMDELLKSRRTVLDPNWEGKNLIPGDVLWSDPSMNPGLSLNKDRGIGLLWGPDVTEEFLRKFHIKLIIRSHEGPDARDKNPNLDGMGEGYTIDHVVQSGKLITLFSAPDYPQFQVANMERYNNKGAYIVLSPPSFDTPDFHSFEAVSPRPKANAYYDYESVADSDEELDLTSMS